MTRTRSHFFVATPANVLGLMEKKRNKWSNFSANILYGIGANIYALATAPWRLMAPLRGKKDELVSRIFLKTLCIFKIQPDWIRIPGL